MWGKKKNILNQKPYITKVGYHKTQPILSTSSSVSKAHPSSRSYWQTLVNYLLVEIFTGTGSGIANPYYITIVRPLSGWVTSLCSFSAKTWDSVKSTPHIQQHQGKRELNLLSLKLTVHWSDQTRRIIGAPRCQRTRLCALLRTWARGEDGSEMEWRRRWNERKK